jgi:hypothetical protein
LETPEASPSVKQGLLERVVGVLERAEHSIAVRVHRAAMRFHELFVGSLVAALRKVEQLFLAAGHECCCGAHSSGR